MANNYSQYIKSQTREKKLSTDTRSTLFNGPDANPARYTLTHKQKGRKLI